MSWQRLLDFCWLFFLLFVLQYFWFKRQAFVRAQKWIKTKGQVTQCEWTKYGYQLWPKIEYLYQVGEIDLSSNDLFLEEGYQDFSSVAARNLAYHLVEAYNQHETIDVYYNPQNPQQAVLDITIPRRLNFVLIFLSALTLIHMGIMLIRLIAYHYP